MYGAVRSAGVQKEGGHHIITVQVDVPSERFLSGKVSLFQEALSLLFEVLTGPKQGNGVFYEGNC
ncbi:hypothetical protein [Shouchella lonarensis]|uniref:Uncharacterized protein n=1 Tax=Shouchella lonarensis TaxID=1464122 RepID=A0A1G6M8L3_9BACI|nr:hypothetical protein [Shouchella lonarensis]SDC51644.1 hypothetical protein SAMN05421737_109121 [Shouchella lonarensis]